MTLVRRSFLREGELWIGEEKDRKPMRVGGLERDKPILLLIDTP
jgi:hypothetical protein